MQCLHTAHGEVAMSRRSAFVLGLAVVAALAASGLAQAAVPETTIKKMQDSTTEALKITVTSVQEVKEASSVPGHPGCTRTVSHLTVSAKVDLVRRSASGLMPGSSIGFDHTVITVWPCHLPGVNAGPMLSAGDRVEVYLRPAGTPGGKFLPNDLKKLR
jgi:hypothetical protein